VYGRAVEGWWLFAAVFGSVVAGAGLV